MKKITTIRPKSPILNDLKKVAAYARVSTETERLHHSLSAQVSYYSKLIQSTPEWEYVGVYADDGLTGTKDCRDAFQDIINDCKNGKIDIIITKSISRFARNTVDLLKTVRYLKSIGVEVRFEKENISSFSKDGELMLTLLASFAQEEVSSISNNIKWTIQKKFEQGIPVNRARMYGYTWNDDHLEIVPEEAEIVKLIYSNYLNKISAERTVKQLKEMGIKTFKGVDFHPTTIRSILQNITYTGNLLLQKEFVVDPISKKKKRNYGELPQYYVENTHEPIIDMDTFQKVQIEKARRKELGQRANFSLNITCFTAKIICEECGSNFVRSSRNVHLKSGIDKKRIFWVCGSTKSKGSTCTSKMLPENLLKSICTDVLGLSEFDEKEFTEKVIQIAVPEHHKLIFHMTDGEIIHKNWSNKGGYTKCLTQEK